jgi:hypothetical protein
MTQEDHLGLRDIDLVLGINDDSWHSSISKHYDVLLNNFGGCRIRTQQQTFDMWSLYSTWAFQTDKSLLPSFSELPKTTFLNVEAIAVEVDSEGQVHEVYEHGFFDALRTRIVEINYESNPSPYTAVTRALVTAHRLKFAIGPRLTAFIAGCQPLLSVEEAEQFQLSHYERVWLDGPELSKQLEVIVTHHHERPDEPLSLHEYNRDSPTSRVAYAGL